MTAAHRRTIERHLATAQDRPLNRAIKVLMEENDELQIYRLEVERLRAENDRLAGELSRREV